jgi:zinc protease
VVVIDLPNAGQAAVFALARAVDRKSPDFYPLSIANAVYGGGSNGRLFQEVRAKRGLSYGANSSISSRREAGLLAASAQTKNETAPEVARLIMSELARLGSEPIPAADIEKRKAFLLGGFGRQIETSGGLSNYLASLVQYDLPLSEIQTYPATLMAATPQTINAAVARDLPAGQASILVVGDAKVFGEEMRKLWPNAEFIPAAEVDLDSPTLRKR